MPAAFPGAEGWGASTAGGRGGTIIHVTNLNNSGVGSLRTAITTAGARTIVFDVGGTVTLASPITINQPNLTIAGQTAPGGGILLKGTPDPNGHSGQLRIEADDVIMRYIRIRGEKVGTDGGLGQSPIGIVNAKNIIIDHCSWSWGWDDAQVWQSVANDNVTDVTVQWCIIAEGLFGHSTGLIVGGLGDYDVEPPDETYLSVKNISIHHNLFVHNADRNPRISCGGGQIINNVVYNWGTRVGVSSQKNNVDFINNYWKAGPMKANDFVIRHEARTQAGALYPIPSLYVAGNIVPGVLDDPAANNQTLVTFNPVRDWPESGPLPTTYFRDTPLAQALYPITIQTAAEAYAAVLVGAGAGSRLNASGAWVANLDAVDQRVIADVLNSTGPASAVVSPAAAGGFPNIDAGVAYQDTDNDGIPNSWETAKGLNPNNDADGKLVVAATGYTNLETFLNGPAASPSVGDPARQSYSSSLAHRRGPRGRRGL